MTFSEKLLSSMFPSKCILYILNTDLILFHDAPDNLLIITSTVSFKKIWVKEGVTRHANHSCMSCAKSRRQHCISNK